MAKHIGTDQDFLAMALVGYEAQRARIEAAISEIQAQLGHRGPGRPSATKVGAAPKKHTLSAAARKKIAEIQARWAAVKAQGKSAAKPAAPKKRKMSAAARKRIGDATRKRWAAYRKAGGKKAAAASA